MKLLLSLFLLCATFAGSAQRPAEYLIIVTTDGLRWQEVFTGMDTAIANNPRYHQDDSALIAKKYGGPDAETRRRKLLPFFWSVFGTQGQVYGNRLLGNQVNVANPYAFSYPGYSELLTGFADTAINSNSYPPNPHLTLLEFLHSRRGFKGGVAAFGAWNAFDRILNEGRAGFPVISAFDTVGGRYPNERQRRHNAMLADSYKPWNTDECLDVFTHYAAMDHLRASNLRVLYIAYGETDEWAHSGQYRSYLDAANQVDAWLRELWTWIQNDPRYKNKTAILFTTDHGRGDAVKSEWTSHGASVQGSSATWFALLAPGLPAKGEMKEAQQLYQQQLAQTLAGLMGFRFLAPHPVAEEVDVLHRTK